MPDGVRSLYDSLREAIDRRGLPDVLDPLTPTQVRDVPVPDQTLAQSAVVAQVHDLGALALQQPAHHVDRRVVPVEEAGRGHEPDRVHRRVQGRRARAHGTPHRGARESSCGAGAGLADVPAPYGESSRTSTYLIRRVAANCSPKSERRSTNGDLATVGSET